MASGSTAGRDRAPMWARVHLIGFTVWALSLVVAFVLGGGQRVAVDTAVEYVLLGVMAAMTGVFVLAAVRTARRRS